MPREKEHSVILMEEELSGHRRAIRKSGYLSLGGLIMINARVLLSAWTALTF